MADLGAIGVRVDERRFMTTRWVPFVPAQFWWMVLDPRFMPTRWVPFVPDQLWSLVPDPRVMPRLLAPYMFDNLAEERVPWLSLGYGDSWYSRPRPLREPTYTLSMERGAWPPCYPEDLVSLGGQVQHPDPGKVGVCLYEWASRRVLGLVGLDESGAWRAEVPPGRCGITYQADGAQPVTHGPYTF